LKEKELLPKNPFSGWQNKLRLMDIRRFFCDDEPKNSIMELTGEESYHLIKVLRVRKGTEIEITDGKGSLYLGSIDSFTGHSVRVKVKHTEKKIKNDSKIIIAPSLLKRVPMNLMIEKLTEIGVDEISPVIFNRTELKASDKLVEKWKKIAIASIKVNKRVWLTKINSPIIFEEIIKKYNYLKNKYILDIQGEKCTDDTITDDLIAVIGPPGDYIKKERDILIENAYKSVKINSSILKVETAAISFSALLKEKEYRMKGK